ncbi:hypothetical protein EV196_11335 [Mariniflexile fucanivorans]|uniref:Uncharacterized protein n=1 Tax=Mariniflexile fucanivorans TaxID=264023 RepID=A0A4R1R9T5_9FLAO|nr:hypothetical protein [Mariniflexile fucanivorans]TCL62494.1 hypothetical protein EV196_11335 [Mariniflexile fucanivorans]
MIIYRAIYLNSFDKLDKLNFGCHWTKDELYLTSIEFLCNDISEKGRQGKIQFLFKTKINENQINELATAKSNNEYLTENECVLQKNILLKNVILIYPKEYSASFSVNTGTRCDKWIE